MEPVNKANTIDRDTLVLVLNEFTEEQRKVNDNVHNLSIAFESLVNKINLLESKMKEQNLNKSGDSFGQELYIRGRLKELKLLIQGQPKSIVKKYQILLFPEREAHLFYKIIFGRWYLVLFLMVLITRVYSFGVHWTNNNRVVEIEQGRNAIFRKAWVSLYQKTGKIGRLEMDSIYMKTNR